MRTSAKLLLSYLNQVMYDPESAVLDVQALPEEFREFGERLTYFAECVMETTALAEVITQGNLDAPLPPSTNEIAAPLKSLHAALKHLTWQSQQVARGDYQQRVDFMGDFSTAFNDMTTQLAEQRATLLSKLELGRRENQSLIQNKNMYKQLVGRLEQWVVMADVRTGEWLFVSNEPDHMSADSDAMERFRQWTIQQTKGAVSQAAASPEELELECSGTKYYYSVSLHPIYWNQRNALVIALTDISREKKSLLVLQDIADHDPMTRLYNRRYGMQLLNEWLTQDQSFILTFVDIDNLKEVNDRFGHGEGDRYIICVSKILSAFSKEATVCRLGGDEFMLLAENWGEERAGARLEQLKEIMAKQESEPGMPIYERSISYGLTRVDKGNLLRAGDLLSAADEKMYEYKRAYKAGQKEKRKRKNS